MYSELPLYEDRSTRAPPLILHPLPVCTTAGPKTKVSLTSAATKDDLEVADHNVLNLAGHVARYYCSYRAIKIPGGGVSYLDVVCCYPNYCAPVGMGVGTACLLALLLTGCGECTSLER